MFHYPGAFCVGTKTESTDRNYVIAAVVANGMESKRAEWHTRSEHTALRGDTVLKIAAARGSETSRGRLLPSEITA